MTFMVSGWSQGTVLDVIAASPDHTLLAAAVDSAGLNDALSGAGPLTVFAPTDSAINAGVGILGITVEELLALPNLANILTYHVVADSIVSGDLTEGGTATTLFGADLTFSTTGGAKVEYANIGPADLPASNGVVHVIDAVLLTFGCVDADACNYDPFAIIQDGQCVTPGTMCDDGNANTVDDMINDACECAGVYNTVVDIIVDSPNHETLEAAVIAADLAGALSEDGPFTVFAPTDDAFAAIDSATLAGILADVPALTAILTLHVHGGNVLAGDLMDQMMVSTLNGEELTISLTDSGAYVNNALITVTDLEADNGVVHVIDAVLLPAPPPPLGTVVDIIVNSPDHETLEAAVIAADLAGALSEDGPFTVFAPTDDAFAAIDSATLAGILADVPTLTAILTYHVHGGNALSTDLMDGMEVFTLNGAPVTVTINEEGTFINDAQVIVVDLIGSNGVVHVIDAVLLPPTPDNIDEVVVNWAVMPNPAKDVFTLTGVAPTARIAMIDLTGRTVREFAQGTTVLSVGDMPRGTYLLTVTEGRNIQTKKVMVQ